MNERRAGEIITHGNGTDGNWASADALDSLADEIETLMKEDRA